MSGKKRGKQKERNFIYSPEIIGCIYHNRTFSKVVRIVDDEGMAVILKNNKPKYIIVGFDGYESIHFAIEERKKKLTDTAGSVMEKYDDALRELAK